MRILGVFLVISSLAPGLAWPCSPEPRTDPDKMIWPTGNDAPVGAAILMRTTLGPPSLTVSTGGVVASGTLTTVGDVFAWRPDTPLLPETTYDVSVDWHDQLEGSPSLVQFTTGTRAYAALERTAPSPVEFRQVIYHRVEVTPGTGGMCATTKKVGEGQVLHGIIGPSGLSGETKDFALLDTTPAPFQRLGDQQVVNMGSSWPKTPCFEAVWRDPVTAAEVARDQVCGGVVASSEVAGVTKMALGANLPPGCNSGGAGLPGLPSWLVGVFLGIAGLRRTVLKC